MTTTLDINHPNKTRKKLPPSWRWITLGEVADYYNGCAFAPEDWSDTGLPIIRIQNLTSPEAPFHYFNGEVESRHKVNSGDLLISWSASLDAFIWNRGPAILNQHIFKVAEHDKIISRDYLYFAVREAMGKIRAQVHGATMLHITKPEFEAIEIPLPPLAEQQRIVAILNEQMAAVQKAKEATEAQLEAAKKLPTTYLRSIFNGVEASNWPTKKLGQILKLRKEIIHPHDKPEGPATFVGLEHIESLTGKRIGALEVEMSKLTGRKPRFFAGDIVYGYLRPYLNKVWIAEFDGLCSVDQYVYSVDRKQALVEFVAWFMRSPVYLARAPIDTTPGQLPRIRTEEVAAVEINLPEIEEQNRVVHLIEARMSAIQRIHQSLKMQLESINKLSAALLRCAFNGEL